MSKAQESAVRDYMVLIRRPTHLRDKAAVAELRARIRESDDGVERLLLQQQLLELEQPPMERYAEAFVQHAKAWAESRGIEGEAFAAEGVDAEILRRAGFDSVDGTQRSRSLSPATRRHAEARRRRAREALALVNEGVQFGEDGRVDEELAVYEAVVTRFGNDAAARVRAQVARALVYTALTLAQLGRVDEELSAYRQVVARFGDDAAVGVRVQVATALLNRGVRLGELGRVDEELSAYAQVVARFGDHASDGVRAQVARAMAYEAMTLAEAGRDDDVFAAVDALLDRFGDDDAEGVREQVMAVERWRVHDG